MLGNEGISNANDPTTAFARPRSECGLDVGSATARRGDHRDAKRPRHRLRRMQVAISEGSGLGVE